MSSCNTISNHDGKGLQQPTSSPVPDQREPLVSLSPRHNDFVVTIILVNNVHCASCVTYISEVLHLLGEEIHDVQVSIVLHEVRVLHTSAIATLEICQVLIDAAFEVHLATTLDKFGRASLELSFAEKCNKWFAAADILRQPQHMPPRSASMSGMAASKRSKRKRHIENCAACQAGKGYRPEKTFSESLSPTPLEKSSQQSSVSDRVGAKTTEAADGDDNQQISSETPRMDKAHATNTHDVGLNRGEPDPDATYYSVSLAIAGMTCGSCTSAIKSALEGLDYVKSVNVSLITDSAEVEYFGQEERSRLIIDMIEDIGYEAEVAACRRVDSGKRAVEIPASDESKQRAIFSIGGMTCVSCSNAITDGLRQFPYVETVTITLMTNSGEVVYFGKEHLEELVERIKDLGYDCTIERCNTVESPKDLEYQSTSNSNRQSNRRSIRLRVEGMFCDHCPPRIIGALKSTGPGQVTIGQYPTLSNPVISLEYMPKVPDFTIRSIISTINSIDESFTTFIYHQPTIEERSQAMQTRERIRLQNRLILSFIVAIPTFLIGVVWMSLLSKSNHIRIYFEKPVWSGTVTRTEWALFLLATPVMFLAADVFHVRAIKEIRALWRKASRVPILRRFYRFGSMNLLISAGTSVAYFASLALLIIGAMDKNGTRSASSGTTYFDSVVFLTFFILIGRYLEAYSKSKTGDAVALLGNLRPQDALLVVSSGSESSFEKETVTQRSSTKIVNADLLEIGDVVLCPKGASPPADGVILKGSTQFDESSLTGESRGILKGSGDLVFSGAVNVGNPITIEITEVGGTSMLDQIVSVVREGRTKRAPVERVADILTGYFVPVITALAIVTFFIWFSLGQSGTLSQRYLDGQRGGWAFWSLEFAIAVFVVACPCGIGLAAPTALFVGGGLAAKHGVLVRGGGEAFQEASDLDAVVFDKTGTLTEGGDLKVTDHETLVPEEDTNIAWSMANALGEQSTHPIARAILNFTTLQPSVGVNADVITEESGLGLRGTFTVRSSSGSGPVTYEAALGSESLMKSLGQSLQSQSYFISRRLSLWQSQSRSVALLALRRLPTKPITQKVRLSSTPTDAIENNSTKITTTWNIAAIFATTDPIRPSALLTIQALHSRGLPVYMLTGDNLPTANAVASSLGIPIANVFAGVLPTQKAEKIAWLQEHVSRRASKASIFSPAWLRFLRQCFSKDPHHDLSTMFPKQKAKIAFVGDGINDAPALSTATVSISLAHPSTSDIAISSSSFILLSSSLDSLITLLDLSSRVFSRIKFNFAWALVYNVVLVPIAAGVLFWVKQGGWRLGPVWASAAMAASSVSVVVSSLLLRWEGGWTPEWIIRCVRRRRGEGVERRVEGMEDEKHEVGKDEK